ncbi:MAG: Mitochondrial matrix cochaperone [Watsoniomyces obsoletus]|nr:MAG: Mitochondrial matrix cochaperone [Watsoniomyces obsoletus]
MAAKIHTPAMSMQVPHADVYRRDAIDRSHYPIFHQMEGARLWHRQRVEGGDVTKAIQRDLSRLPIQQDIHVEDVPSTIDPIHNPLQEEYHTAEEVEVMAAHLKRSLEGVMIDIFSRAREAAVNLHQQHPFTEQQQQQQQPLRMRWVPAYFPFTSPSWELEVQWENTWLELLGCGIVKQPLLNQSNAANKVGWAFGVGLERIAMLLFSIPDIRLFWSTDERFLNQFAGIEDGGQKEGEEIGRIKRFVEFSKHPPSWRDVAFWLPHEDSSASSIPSTIQTQPNHQKREIHENDIMALIRDAGSSENIEDVSLVDEFIHPTSGRKSRCYRVMYRRLDRTLTNPEVNTLHDTVRSRLVRELGVELR